MEHKLHLPIQISTPVEVGRLVRELESIDEQLLQLGIRQPGSKVKMPQTTSLLDKLAEVNQLNLLHPADRKILKDFLVNVRTKSPILHISFSADPSPAFIEKLMAWLRREIHSEVLLTIGLQPSIGAGCVMRSTNKYFDFSLSQNFAKKRDLLLAKLAAGTAEAKA